MESRQDRSPAFAPKGGELDPECGVLDTNGLVAAHQKSEESEQQQEESCHVTILRVYPTPIQSSTSGSNNSEGQP
jgi:hypothetical protein